MNYFADLSFFRFNHLCPHEEHVSRTFGTFSLNYAAQGTVMMRIDDAAPLRLDAPVAYWTWPGPHFDYQSLPDSPWEHYFVSFYGPRTERWCDSGLLPIGSTSPVMRITRPLAFVALFDALIESLAENLKENADAVHQLEGLLLQLHAQPSHELAYHPRRHAIQALINRVRGDPGRAVDWAAEAQRIAVTPSHLRRLMVMFTERPPTLFHREVRLRHAAALLRTTNLPVKAVADEVGYDDIYYFTKCFQQHHGIPPGRYRRVHQRMGAEIMALDERGLHAASIAKDGA